MSEGILFGMFALSFPASVLIAYWATRSKPHMKKQRYFARDAKGNYRGLFNLDPEHVTKLRDKGWTFMRASNRFGRIHPWYQVKGDNSGD